MPLFKGEYPVLYPSLRGHISFHFTGSAFIPLASLLSSQESCQDVYALHFSLNQLSEKFAVKISENRLTYQNYYQKCPDLCVHNADLGWVSVLSNKIR